MKKYYPPVRSLHLYFGLFISPFVLIFSIGVLIFNHIGFINQVDPIKNFPEIRTKLDRIPYDTSDLGTAKAIIKMLNINGEVDFISKNDSTISFPVNKPGFKTYIRVSTNTDSVLIRRESEGPLRSMSYLHSMPGPHNAKVRGNSAFIKGWKIISDVVVYLLMFLTASGIFLWYILKAERKVGLWALALGILSFIGAMVLIF